MVAWWALNQTFAAAPAVDNKRMILLCLYWPVYRAILALSLIHIFPIETAFGYRSRCHCCFTAAHISLYEPHHWLVAIHILIDFTDYPLLGFGQRVGEQLLEGG